MPSELSRCISKEEWCKATELCKLHPHQARVWCKHDGFFDGRTPARILPLHQALSAAAAAALLAESETSTTSSSSQVTTCILAIIRAYPQALQERETSFGRLPLHVACRKACSLDIIALVAEYWPQACLEPDALDRLPIHYALSNGSNPAVIKFLLEADPRQARGVDHRGWTPLHVACSLAAPEIVVRRILEIYPESVLYTTKRGHCITSCLPKQHPNRNDIKELLLTTKEKMESTLQLQSFRDALILSKSRSMGQLSSLSSSSSSCTTPFSASRLSPFI